MAKDSIGTQIETLIQKEKWEQAETAIEKQLCKEPEDHWLWSRLSGVKYEKRDYQGALAAAEKALEIVPDCPLALWSKAGALEVRGKVDEAMMLYLQLARRGLEELKNPDQDADECWEGPDWTSALMADCVFRLAGGMAKTGKRDKAVETYRHFLGLGDLGIQGIYSHADALEMLNKLVRSKKARREAVVKMMELIEV
jgi:tetratricopeptide (TPR) repeat protein